MHWVWATSPEGIRTPVNLAAICSMLRGKAGDKDVTMLFLGGMAISVQGQVTYANTQVLETPEELFALPKIDIGPVLVKNGKTTIYPDIVEKARRPSRVSK